MTYVYPVFFFFQVHFFLPLPLNASPKFSFGSRLGNITQFIKMSCDWIFIATAEQTQQDGDAA